MENSSSGTFTERSDSILQSIQRQVYGMTAEEAFATCTCILCKTSLAVDLWDYTSDEMYVFLEEGLCRSCAEKARLTTNINRDQKRIRRIK
jgi:hypothetical protein